MSRPPRTVPLLLALLAAATPAAPPRPAGDVPAAARARARAWLEAWDAQDDAAVLAWEARIRPTASERSFERIPWLTTFGDGIREADARGRPLLLWVMNGHPLGCT